MYITMEVHRRMRLGAEPAKMTHPYVCAYQCTSTYFKRQSQEVDVGRANETGGEEMRYAVLHGEL